MTREPSETRAPVDSALRCGIDTVEIARVERLLRETPRDDLARMFTPRELEDAGDGGRRAAHLAARLAAREACLKLFPRETALGSIGPADFSVERDGYGAPRVACSDRVRELLDRYRLSRIALSVTHGETSACAVAVTEPLRTEAPFLGRLLFHALPIRRSVVLSNLRRIFGDAVAETEIVRIAQAHYAHFARLCLEFVTFPFTSASRRASMIRIENVEAILRAKDLGKGVLVLTGHFGNWEVATVAGLSQFPQYRGRLHFVRKPLNPEWLDRWVVRRFERAGFGVFRKRGASDAMRERLEAGDAVVVVFDQHAAAKDGVRVEFFGHPAGTYRSLALLALVTGAAVVPVSSWREPDGRHVLRFEEALAPIEHEDADEAIRLNTRAYNAALEPLVLRHPEQWFLMHRRWKVENELESRRESIRGR